MVKEMASNFDNLSKEEKFKAGIKLYLSLVTPPLTLAKTAKPLLPAVPLRINPPRAAKNSLGGLTVSSLNVNVTNSSQKIARAHNAANPNAKVAINKKLSALEKAQKLAVKTETIADGITRYYANERLANKLGPTRGSSYVTEHNSKTGQIRSWIENYAHDGSVNRVHPKMLDGQDLISQHYPPTKVEIDAFLKKRRGPQ